MTGAAGVLAGFSDLSVIIHGSSGCYYYPRSLLKVPIYSTYLIESEIVLGTVERLHEVIESVSKTKNQVAVVNTCVPALTGEDLRNAVLTHDTNVIFVDAPGFSGSAEDGVKQAYEALNIRTNPERFGVNINGVSLLDLFWRGNLYEAERFLADMQIPIAVCFAKDTYENLKNGAAEYSVSVNPSFDAEGKTLGSLLFPNILETVQSLSKVFPNADSEKVLSSFEKAEEQIYYSCDKYLRRYSPPTVAVAAQESYAIFAKEMMEKYFGSDVSVIFSRNESAKIPCSRDSREINAEISKEQPDLILGSSYEKNACDAAFFGITYPDRTRVSISARPLAGVEGGLTLIEGALNALMNWHSKTKQ